MTPSVTLFSWGYEGWGSSTDQLIASFDAVERSRGWGPLLFVDIRASRKVRALGFRERAFEKRFGLGRYQWMNGLGNEAILSGANPGKFVDPAAAGDLLDVAIELHREKRRIIFFCSCPIPCVECHRHEVAPVLFGFAKQRGVSATVVEWPGYESDPPKRVAIETSADVFKGLIRGTRRSVPLGPEMPDVLVCGLPWYTPVRVRCDDSFVQVLVGPAEYKAGGWQVRVLDVADPDEDAKARVGRVRREQAVELTTSDEALGVVRGARNRGKGQGV